MNVEPTTQTDLISEILRLRAERDVVILAHNYQIPAIQEVADFVGDSLGLSRAAARSRAGTIVFCGVHFMAETAAILCPDKRVLIPDPTAGCSLADGITAAQLAAWKAEHPGAVVVSYVNTTAAVKALSDYCCTSGNAVEIVNAIPADQEILFLPDMYLGAWVQAQTGRTNMHLWLGECHVHAALRPADITQRRAEFPDAELLVHPECGCSTPAMFHVSTNRVSTERTAVLSTEGMMHHAAASTSREFIVATEIGILHRLERDNPTKRFIPLRADASCRYMKQITLANLYRSLRDDQFEVTVEPEVAARARVAIERMVAIG